MTLFHINEKLRIKISRVAHSSSPTLKATAITQELPAVIFYYSTLNGTNRQILTPKRSGSYFAHFSLNDVGNGKKRDILSHLNLLNKLSRPAFLLVNAMKRV